MQLSRTRAYECEYALEKRCRCRCGGKLHGAKRVRNVEDLPAGDPHHVPKDIDTGLRAIVKLDRIPARIRRHKVYQAQLECGHKLRISGSKLGPNRSRAHCEQCAPVATLQARQRRAEGMDQSLMEFFKRQEKSRRRYRASQFPTGLWHVVADDDDNHAVSPGSTSRRQVEHLAAMMNRLPV